ncbi:ARL14 effector protein isoform X2 [Vespula pensylvanica]|uniref:ARL14 effector protein isoform X2 n=1 Tax=Vespula pensylvanica TaxID=30213 RepID=UPI001CBA4C1F|nr:ARL14 effector protein isoform X2 [Vespula pensylvanica]
MSDEKILKTNMETNSSSKEATTQQVNNVEMPSRSRGGRGSRQRAVDNITKKFLRNFDPERSEREKRKLHRRLYQGSKRHTLYNDEGIWVITGDNLCDCLSLECAGCHFPCPKCSSSKCGHECRNIASLGSIASGLTIRSKTRAVTSQRKIQYSKKPK